MTNCDGKIGEEYSCDRCGKYEFIDDSKNKFITTTMLFATGEEEVTLCEDCMNELKQRNKEFMFEFMGK